jgi:iron complex outermembrane recepter protein
VAVAAPATAKKTFDLPVDAADRSIKRFYEQAGLEVFYPSSATKGLKTQPVKGEMTAREALAAMLAGSRLRVVEDEKTGALAIVSLDKPKDAEGKTNAVESDVQSSAKKKSHKP